MNEQTEQANTLDVVRGNDQPTKRPSLNVFKAGKRTMVKIGSMVVGID